MTRFPFCPHCSILRTLMFVVACTCSSSFVMVDGARGNNCKTDAVLDAREVKLWYSRDEKSPGILTGGGYARAGSTMTKYGYRLIGGSPDDVTIEVVEHSANYEHVKHDLLGTLLLVSGGVSLAKGEASARSNSGVEIVGWKPGDNGNCQRLYSATGRGEREGGVAGWSSAAVDSNGTVTVVIRYSSKGIPEVLLSDFLVRYPSNVEDVPISPREWMDADLKKWIAILRAGPASAIELQVASANLLKYERLANEDWGARDLRQMSVESPELDARIESIAAKAEEWHQTHRFVQEP